MNLKRVVRILRYEAMHQTRFIWMYAGDGMVYVLLQDGDDDMVNYDPVKVQGNRHKLTSTEVSALPAETIKNKILETMAAGTNDECIMYP